MEKNRRTQVGIVGGGPSGLLMGHALRQAGIDVIVVERQTEAHVAGRVRAGLLEITTTDFLERLDVADRLRRDGIPKRGFNLSDGDHSIRIDLEALIGRGMVMYGQTEIQRDLIDAAEKRGLEIIWDAKDVSLFDIDSDHPSLSFVKDGVETRVECDFIVGCDGFHGVSRRSIPASAAKVFEREYPFGWLGILSDVPPCSLENIYANHERGFALASLRSKTRSRYYIQVPLDEKLENWSDDRLWDELERRLGETPKPITRGPALEKSVTPLRSFVFTPMRHGRLFLVGDSAHIVPPTGAKGLNLAASDAIYLSDALIAFFGKGDEAGLDGYCEKALKRVWRAEWFSYYMTTLMHPFPDATPFDRAMQVAQLEYVGSSIPMQTAIAENYAGMPL